MKKIIMFFIFLMLFSAALVLAFLAVLAIQDKGLHFLIKTLILSALVTSEITLMLLAAVTYDIVNAAFD